VQNPIVSQRDLKPLLPWRRKGGRECANCPWVLCSWKEYDKDKGELEQEFKDTPSKRDEFTGNSAFMSGLLEGMSTGLGKGGLGVGGG
jgi:hypothetical protein